MDGVQVSGAVNGLKNSVRVRKSWCIHWFVSWIARILWEGCRIIASNCSLWESLSAERTFADSSNRGVWRTKRQNTRRFAACISRLHSMFRLLECLFWCASLCVWVVCVLCDEKCAVQSIDRWTTQKLKFTAENMIYYIEYVFGVEQLNWMSLKYLDEASFQSRGIDFDRSIDCFVRSSIDRSIDWLIEQNWILNMDMHQKERGWSFGMMAERTLLTISQSLPPSRMEVHFRSLTWERIRMMRRISFLLCWDAFGMVFWWEATC